MIEDLLFELRHADVRLWLEGEKLRFSAPRGALDGGLRERMMAQRDALVARLRKDLLGSEPPTLRPVPRSNPLPLSFVQEQYWIVDQMDPGSAAYNIPIGLSLVGELDRTCLEAALAGLAERHELLRTTCATVDQRPVQTIHAELPVPLVLCDLSGLSAAEREAEADRIAAREQARPFDFARGPHLRATLIRLHDHEHRLVLITHHFVADGWSIGILLRELGVLYGAFRRARTPQLAPLPVQYLDFAVWQRALVQGGFLDSLIEAWRRQLSGAPPSLELPSDRPRPAVAGSHGAMHWFQVPSDLVASLAELARRERVTLFVVLLAALKLVLHRHSGQDDMLVATAVSNRNRHELEGLIGSFANNLCLRTDLSGDPSFSELLARVRTAAFDAYANQDLPFVQLLEALGIERDPSRAPLCQVMFLLHNGLSNEFELDGLTVAPVPVVKHTSRLDLTIELTPNADGLLGWAEYSTDLFDQATIARMLQQLVLVLEQVASDPSPRLSQIRLLRAAERRWLLEEQNDTGAPISSDRCLHELFRAQARRSPDALAVVSDSARLTYHMLACAVDRLARELIDLGARPNTLIGVLMEKGWEQVVAVLAILQAGAAYLPLDPALPRARLEQLLIHAKVDTVVIQPWIEVSLPTDIRVVVAPSDRDIRDFRDIHANEELTSRPGSRAELPAVRVQSPEDLAYVIYTSGSTGAPKGVMIDHRGAVNTILDLNERFRVSSDDRVFALSALSFDLSVYDIFGTLAAGAAIVLPRPSEQRDPDAWADWIASERVTIWNSVPALMTMLVDHEQYATARPGARIQSLRAIWLSGDWIPLTLPDRIRALIPTAEVISMGGATEASIWSIIHPIGQVDPTWRSIPYGRPLRSQKFFVLDAALEPCPIGVPGMLYIGGVGVAQGYLHDPDLTAAAFFEHPTLGERLYRTGDLGRYLVDGSIEFLGRKDFQVKIRGYRIELGEIEATLAQRPGVRASAVEVYVDRSGAQRLVAYVVLDEPGPTHADLRTFLHERLPEYMVPQTYVSLDAMPLSSNGKIDRRALPDARVNESDTVVVDPQTPTQELLVGIWKGVLEVERIGIHDNFFELGGDSILCIQVVSRATQAGFPLVPRQLFENPTIAMLAAVGTSSGVAAAEQGVLTGEAPLTPMQRWFFERFDPTPTQWNQGVVLSLREPIEPALLREAIQALMHHHDSLRLRFWREQGEWTQRYATTDDFVPFESMDLDASESTSGFARETARVQASMDLEQGPMFRALHVRCGGAAERLLLTAHHLVVDAVSWQILIEDLETACTQLRRAQPITLPTKTASYRQWGRARAHYGRSAFLRERAPAWLALASEPNGTSATSWDCESSARRVSATLDESVTRSLIRDVAAKLPVTTETVLLALLARVVGDHLGRRRLIVELEAHNRDELAPHPGGVSLDVQRTVGWFTALFPVALDLDPSLDPIALVTAVDHQRAAGPPSGGDYATLRYLGDPDLVAKLEMPIPELGFNYMGRIDRMLLDGALFEIAEIPDAARSDSCARMHRWSVDCFVVAGRLQIWWTYSPELEPAGVIEGLMQRYRAALEHFVHALGEHADSPADFPELQLDSDDMSRLLDELGLGADHND